MLNDTKVFPARLRGTKESGGKVEVLLLERFPEPSAVSGLLIVDAAKKPPVGSRVRFDANMTARGDRRSRRRSFWVSSSIIAAISTRSLKRSENRRCRPTCTRIRDGEAFGPGALSDRLRRSIRRHRGADRGISLYSGAVHQACKRRESSRALLTLHVGPGTFQPVREE